MTWLCLLDADADDREVLAEALRAAGHDVRTFADATDALDAVAHASSPPALIVLDLLVAGMSALEFLRALRSGPRGPRVPVVVMTGVDVAESTFAPFGVEAILHKPIPLRTLLAVVARALTA